MNAELLKSSLNTDKHKLEFPTLEQQQRLAAVLILLVPGVQGPELVFTQRSQELPSHAGQISFPGGSVDDTDNGPIHTALREAEEEIGLYPANVEVLGTLEWYTMPTGFVVLPVVGQLQEIQEFVPEPNEVDDIFTLPLQSLLDPALFQQEFLVRNNIKRNFYSIEINGYYIWGATAHMLRSLALKLGQGS